MKQLHQYNILSKVSYSILLISLLIHLTLPQANVFAAPLAVGVGGCAQVDGVRDWTKHPVVPGTNYGTVGALTDGTIVKVTGLPAWLPCKRLYLVAA